MKMKTISLLALATLSQGTFAKTLFCKSTNALSVRVQPAEASRRLINLPSLDWFLDKPENHLEREQPTSTGHNLNRYGNDANGVWSVTHGECNDGKHRKFNIHIVGAGLSLRTNNSFFTVECPVISNKRFGPIGYIARFAGTKAVATVGVGAEAGVYTNVRGGLCVIAGINTGIGAGVEIGSMAINRVASEKFIHEDVANLLALSDEDLMKTFEKGVGLIKMVKNPLQPNQPEQTFYFSFRPEYKHDDDEVIKASLMKGMSTCSVPKVKDLFDYYFSASGAPSNTYSTWNRHNRQGNELNRGLVKDAPALLRAMLEKGCIL